jgi:hypothetical protein
MGFSYELSAGGRIVRLIGTGDGGAAAARDALATLVRDNGVAATFGLLVDARNINPPPPPEAIRAIASLHRSILGARAPRVALLASEGVLYGIGRQLEAHVETESSAVRVFTDERVALVWLQDMPTAAPPN